MSDIKLEKTRDRKPQCNFCFSEKDIYSIRGIGNLIVKICSKCLSEIQPQPKNLEYVPNSNFKTVIALYEDAKSYLAVSEQILPVHKSDKLTINGKCYEVSYVDYNFDKAIFEVVVVDDN